MAAGSSAWRRVVVPCPLTWHSVLVAAPAATPFLCRRNAAVPRVARQWVRPRSSAMSIDVALSTHYGARRNTAIILRASRLAPRQELSATSMDMALLPAAIFLFYGFCHFASSGADLLFAAFCCIFAVEMKIRASVGPFFRVLKAVPLFGRLFFLSPKP